MVTDGLYYYYVLDVLYYKLVLWCCKFAIFFKVNLLILRSSFDQVGRLVNHGWTLLLYTWCLPQASIVMLYLMFCILMQNRSECCPCLWSSDQLWNSELARWCRWVPTVYVFVVLGYGFSDVALKQKIQGGSVCGPCLRTVPVSHICMCSESEDYKWWII